MNIIDGISSFMARRVFLQNRKPLFERQERHIA